MITNDSLLNVIKESFLAYLETGTSRSTLKLKSLHGNIAADIQEKLGDKYTIKSQGIGDDKEEKVQGRYYPKKVDITVFRDNIPVAGYAVKFVMRNYSQNSVNYFENMLGETANIRSNFIPYFQIFIIFDKIPYFEKGGKLKKYEYISQHNLDKYLILSNDNPNIFFHTPDKALVILLKLKDEKEGVIFKDDNEYNNYYKEIINDPDLLSYSDTINDIFNNSVILNDYEDFRERTCHTILGNDKKSDHKIIYDENK